MALTTQQCIQWLKNCQQILTEKRDYLTELDTEIGDGDHGLNMQRGFTKVVEKLPMVADKDIATILKTVGMTLLSQVGGASGPLYGTFFIKGAQSAVGKFEVSFPELLQIFRDGVAGIVARGKAEVGDKTMCDVWIPLLKELERVDSSRPLADILQSAVLKSQEFLSATIPLVAKKGRASYLAERSAGHQDPGATSSVYILQSLYNAVK
ncbi:dihydroxyacetone kinase subunit DhaL [Pasteurellaceae bacterium LIM206]|nr:dihydroxyacetone kinase subunit DhaL [Pasteurellaceae bacterium LIM206]